MDIPEGTVMKPPAVPFIYLGRLLFLWDNKINKPSGLYFLTELRIREFGPFKNISRVQCEPASSIAL
jgi:hypothetical protein